MPNIFVMAFVATLGPVTHRIFEGLTERAYAAAGIFYTVSLLRYPNYCAIMITLLVLSFIFHHQLHHKYLQIKEKQYRVLW